MMPRGVMLPVILGSSWEKDEGHSGMALVSQAVMGPTELAHLRMGHVAESTLGKMAKAGALQGLPLGEEEVPPCQACLLGKMKRPQFPEHPYPES